MDTKNPRLGEQAGASISIAADTETLTRNRPFIQANPAMAARLRWLRNLSYWNREVAP